LCSQEFYEVISKVPGMELLEYHVPYTKNIRQRVRIKLGMENYSMYDVKKDAPALIKFIEENNISAVFINMASLVKYAIPIKERFADKVKVVMLSHGNHSGDFLHLITKPIHQPNFIRKRMDKYRLGSLISTEAQMRVSELDAVITLSETEKQIENWFGGKRVYFLPRRLYADFLDYKPVMGRVGFMGRLDHPPNYQGISMVLEQLNGTKADIRIVGAPNEWGNKLQQQFPFVKYLGELSDAGLEEEVSTWSLLLNPVWWYSTGASTKLAKAISWGVPIISTTAGNRGYQWSGGELLMSESPAEMAAKISEFAFDEAKIMEQHRIVQNIANNGPSMEELTKIISKSVQSCP